MNSIKVEGLTRESFAPFGEVISHAGMPESEGDFTWYGEMGIMRNDVTQLNLCAMKLRSSDLHELERHTHTKEALVVLEGTGVVLVVAPDGPLDESALRAFYIKRGEGIIFGKGTYHSTPYPVEEPATMLIVFQKDTGDTDLVLHPVSEGTMIDMNSISFGGKV
ncbi:MAG: ureidoglycolate lyase [Clostridia bacterium]|nr:ureidoglycolate lyase [Clostridia bacterium]